MIYYDLGPAVECSSTNIGDDIALLDVVTPEYQAHSVNVAVLPEDIDDTYGVDALVTDVPGLRIGVRTADCVPILVYDTVSHAVGAIHSGWKGTAANIISATVRTMSTRYGCHSENITALIGPCIHLEAFEVGDEVYEAFAAKGYSSFAKFMSNPFDSHSSMKWHIDLPSICEHQLRALGVGNIKVSPLCTYVHHDSLYSYRYSKSSDPSNRIITSIMLRP